ncbi:MAG: selenide, water dikinase SelD [Alphaproteobacteria bacterium]|jgi:selenide,water dikinase|nr:selenide, water dikinase SelD [Alphaproteobacteria bacterium]
MKTNVPLTRDLVLIGGGHTHALVLRKWGMSPLPGVRLTVINPGPTAPYSGMLPGFVAGHYGRDDLDIDLVQLSRFSGARIIADRAEALDPEARTITVEGRGDIAYDAVSVDIGITSEMPGLPGFAEHGIPAKPLGRFAASWDRFRAETRAPSVAVIGGGVAGAELSMAMAHALRQAGHKPNVHLIDRGEVLEEFEDPARDRLLAALGEQGVIAVEGAEVVEVTADAVHLADGRRIESLFTTGAAGARPQGWLAQTGLDCHAGYLSVGPTLQTSAPDVFAVGDCAYLAFDPRPKAGVYAVREAPVLHDNLVAYLSDRPLRRYKPQKDYLKLISLGGKSALAEKLGTARRGKVLWRWKDHIDRKFMRQFRELPGMAPEPPLRAASGVAEIMGQAPLCSGCGAKVGGDALATALKGLPTPDRKDVVSLPGDDAAVLSVGGTRQVISTDHLSAVTEDPALMARIAAIHALGDVWAMGADPQSALISLILPRMSPELQKRTLAEITDAAATVMAQAGAAIVGGHTTQGAAMTIGFTVTGLASTTPITVKGARPGDALILTKPIGSGTILAAEMRGQASGADVLACFDVMMQGQGAAARLLSTSHAMTDVTGFGLAGHLSAICRASGTGAILRDVPVMAGAMDLAAAGIRSSLYPENVLGSLPVNGPEGPLKTLLFDPQTCGGLLAAVDGDEAAQTCAALQDAGYPSRIIGTVIEGDAISVRP